MSENTGKKSGKHTSLYNPLCSLQFVIHFRQTIENEENANEENGNEEDSKSDGKEKNDDDKN